MFRSSTALGFVGVLLLGPSLLLPACKDDAASKGAPSAAGANEGGADAQSSGGAGGDAAGSPSSGAPGSPGAGAAAALAADLCEPPTGEGTAHGPFVADDETWTAADSPHLVPSGLVVDAVLTLEPCAVVRVGAGQDIHVNGKLRAQGEYRAATSVRGQDTLRFVRIERLDAKPWGAIVSSSAGGEVELTATLVDGGGVVPAGTQPLQTGMVVLEGERQTPLAERLTLSVAFLKDSASQGVLLTNNVAFAPGSTLIVTGSAGYPVQVGAQAIGTVPNLYFEGNETDAVLVSTAERLGDAGPTDVTLRNWGYPYVIGTDLYKVGMEVGTGNGDAASLTIEPGVELRFPEAGGLSVEGPDGTLIAEGTNAKPIVFTTAQKPAVAGAWLGLNFTGQLNAATSLDQVAVSYAGALDTGARSFSCGSPPALPSSQQDTMGAIYLSLDVPPSKSFITNSLFTDSASNGVDRGYTGDAIDFSDSNTFERIAFCIQTEPKPTVGACSADPECTQLP
jgi:hypothetical protein